MIGRLARFGITRIVLAGLLLQATTSSADVVILRSGTEIAGTVANRDEVAAHPEAATEISILLVTDMESSLASSFRRYPVSEIQYVVLEDDGRRRVFDFAAAIGRSPLDSSTAVALAPRHSSHAGIFMVVAGVGAFVFGALTRLGSDVTTAVFLGDPSKNDHTASNTFMIGGGALILGGFFLEQRESEKRPVSPAWPTTALDDK